MDKYTAIVLQGKTWHGWKRLDRIIYGESYAHASMLCNQLNDTLYDRTRRRYIIISIDKV